ncbi:hypothetical protein LTR04_005790 [Oleoguttula sp. CCFEE 6159]|nr:hypothetical protein LTR04_005790 [Oleoguttula sp. CCFEE 6159]
MNGPQSPQLEVRTAPEANIVTNGSIRQSPPLNDQAIPTGAILSPPESPEQSDGDESGIRMRGRQMKNECDLAELRTAVRNIRLKRDFSPNRANEEIAKLLNNVGVEVSTTEPAGRSSAIDSRPALSQEARKISHSRSSTETAILIPSRTQFAESPAASSDDSDEENDDDDNMHCKPPLLRKKSGELVKPAIRPRSRRRYSSMPGTPTYKSVHFNTDLVETRHFLTVDKPIAVSAGSSPVETYDSETEYPWGQEDSPSTRRVEWEIRLANFPRETFERKTQPVRVERIFLSSDNKVLIGSVAVQNLSFQKVVIARFTLDYWKTTSEVVAEYNNDVRKKEANDGLDRFNFNIKLADLANLETKTMLLCVRCSVNGQDYWDNNGDTNFQVDFIKKTKQPAKGGMHGLGARPLAAIPRSKHSPPTSNGRPKPSFEDDFSSFDSSKYRFGSWESPSNSIKLKPRSKRGSIFPGAASASKNTSVQGLGHRYDFGASLTAALTNVQDTLTKDSGTAPAADTKSDAGYFGNQHSTQAPQLDFPAAVSSPLAPNKPDINSAQYNEIVKKYCFFNGSGKGSPLSSRAKPLQMDGAHDNEPVSDSSAKNSGASTPSPPSGAYPLHDGTNDRRPITKTASPFNSRSTSPARLTGTDLADRTGSPVSFGYPFHQNHGYMAETHTPTAILG